MALKEDHIKQFEVIVQAAQAGALMLIETTDKNGNYAAFIGAAFANQQRPEDYDVMMVARLFDGDPLTELNPPDKKTAELVRIAAPEELMSAVEGSGDDEPG